MASSATEAASGGAGCGEAGATRGAELADDPEVDDDTGGGGTAGEPRSFVGAALRRSSNELASPSFFETTAGEGAELEDADDAPRPLDEDDEEPAVVGVVAVVVAAVVAAAVVVVVVGCGAAAVSSNCCPFCYCYVFFVLVIVAVIAFCSWLRS